MECANCGIDYPPELLSPIRGSISTHSVCGICALEITNKVLGINRKKFDGQMAEELRLGAIEWRKKNAPNQ